MDNPRFEVMNRDFWNIFGPNTSGFFCQSSEGIIVFPNELN